MKRISMNDVRLEIYFRIPFTEYWVGKYIDTELLCLFRKELTQKAIDGVHYYWEKV
jgi:hypothetical protein